MLSMVLIHLIFFCIGKLIFFQVSVRKGIKYPFVQFNKEKQRNIALSSHPGECAPPPSQAASCSCNEGHRDHFSFACHLSLVSLMKPQTIGLVWSISYLYTNRHSNGILIRNWRSFPRVYYCINEYIISCSWVHGV